MTPSHNPYAPKSQTTDGAVKPPTTPKPQEPEKVVVDPEAVPDGSAADILRWVGKDSERAQKALDAEEAGQQRVGLSKKLAELV